MCAADRIGPRMHVPSCVYWLFIASPFQASACEGGRILYGANTRVRRCMACASSQREGGRIGQGGRARQIHYLNLLQLQLWIRDLCVSSPGAPGSNLCTRIELVSVSEVLRWIGCGGGEASQVYMCDTPLTHWRGGGFMRHVSSSFIEFIKTLVGLHRTVPSPYSQPILTPGWHFNASQNEGSQYGRATNRTWTLSSVVFNFRLVS